jgi:TonB-dependent starch-binding outer membrane protein SusC
LQSLFFAYNWPKKWMPTKIKSCKLYIQGLNLFTITNYKGRDPEVSAGPDNYPSLRVITAGIQLSF